MCLPWIVWEVEERNDIDGSLLHFPAIWLGILEIFLQRPTIALLLQRISHVAQCVYILTKALLLFILLLKIAYVEPMVGETETCTCVTYIAKSNKETMLMTNQISWSRLCTCVEGGWWKWSTPFMDPSLCLLYLDNMMTWLYYYRFFFLGLSCVQLFFATLGPSCVPNFLGHASWASHLFFG